MIALRAERFHVQKEESWAPGGLSTLLAVTRRDRMRPHPVLHSLAERGRWEADISKRNKKKMGKPGRPGRSPAATNKTAGSRKRGTARSDRRPGTVVALLVLTAVQAVGAIGGGIGLVQDPVDNIGMPLSVLEGSPFKDFLIPGIILLVVVGLFALFVWAGLLRRWKPAWWLSLASGGGLVIWIIAEVVLLGYLPGAGIGLQIAFGLIGAAIVVLTLLRPTRRYFGVSA
jgi:hypothetical protein